MESIRVLGVASEGNLVRPEHFGANFVHGINTEPDGSPQDKFWDATNALGVTNLRYPGGSVAEHEMDITEMPNGQLRPELIAFFDDLIEQNKMSGTHARKVDLVIRTRDIEGESEAEYYDTIMQFSEAVMREYGPHISMFQIGNEYWGSGEHEEASYGRKADLAARALSNGIEASEAEEDPEIIIQMANPATRASLFNRERIEEALATPRNQLSDIYEEMFLDAASELGKTIGSLNIGDLWEMRLRHANLTIINQLGEEARSAIDGVLEHSYISSGIEGADLNFGSEFGSFKDGSVNSIDQKYIIWDGQFEKPLSLHVTEWGLSIRAEQYGMREASVAAEQFEYLIKMGVSEAYAWPVQHNVSTTLAGRKNDVAVVDAAGTVINSSRGAVFDIMRQDLPGLRNVELQVEGQRNEIELNAYQEDGHLALQLSNRDHELHEITLDVANITQDLIGVSAKKISYASAIVPAGDELKMVRAAQESGTATSGIHNGLLYDYADTSQGVRIDYLRHLDLISNRNGHVSIELLPYEFIQIVYTYADGLVLEGSDDAEFLLGSELNDALRAHGGNDTLVGGPGADLLDGGAGVDLVDYSASTASLTINFRWGEGNAGDAEGDVFHSIEAVKLGSSSDHYVGQKGAETVFGGAGDDDIVGLDGADEIYGDEGADRLIGHRGSDTLFGGHSNDTLHGDPGDDLIYGGDGADLLHGGRGADALYGGAGDDFLWGGAGEDAFYVGLDEGTLTLMDFEPGLDQLIFYNGAQDIPRDASMIVLAENASSSLDLVLNASIIVRFSGLEQGDHELILDLLLD